MLINSSLLFFISFYQNLSFGYSPSFLKVKRQFDSTTIMIKSHHNHGEV